MHAAQSRPKRLTYQVILPGGQHRLRELVLYVAGRCQSVPPLGVVKLNKMIWRADFESFAERGVPVTGRPYQRLPSGPAPVEMAPILGELERDGLIVWQISERGDKETEKRVVAKAAPDMRWFSKDDLDHVDRAIEVYRDKTGREADDKSLGAAWRSREDGDPMPYELAYLSEARLGNEQKKRLLSLGAERGWSSN